MKKKILLTLALAFILSLLLTISISAVTTYDDAPVRTKYQALEEDIVEFYDGFTCPVSYVFKDTDTIDRAYGNEGYSIHLYFEFDYINEKTGKEYTFEDVRGFDIPEGIKSIGIYAGRSLKTVKWISIPKTALNLANAIFQSASGLEECTFEHPADSTLTTFPSYTFFGCSSLKAFSMPDSITKMLDVAHFSGCKSLTAVHLSNNLTTWQSGGGGSRNATFDDCVSMYFVNESFTYDAIPEKPTVYYFPANLEITTHKLDFSKASTMRECKNLNDVLVFGTKVTSIPNEYLFQGGPANKIVFLGDMESISTKYWGGTTLILFANKNDIDETCVSVAGGKKVAFCFAQGNETHIAEKTMSVEASCEVDSGIATYCFCGFEISKEAVPNTALSHDYDYENNKNAIFVSLIYKDYSENGIKTVTCANCGKNGELKAPALFSCVGYSTSEFSNSGILVGYQINRNAISDYESETGNSVSYGVFAVAKVVIGDNEIFDSQGDFVEGVFGYDVTEYQNDVFEIKVSGFTSEEQKETKLALGAYVIVTSNGKKEYSYMQEGKPTENDKYHFVSFRDTCPLE